MSASTAAAESTTIRPSHISVPEAEIDELRRRVNTTRWPDRETVEDRSQGAQLAKLQELVRYWGHEVRLAWGRGEAERALGGSALTYMSRTGAPALTAAGALARGKTTGCSAHQSSPRPPFRRMEC